MGRVEGREGKSVSGPALLDWSRGRGRGLTEQYRNPVGDPDGDRTGGPEEDQS